MTPEEVLRHVVVIRTLAVGETISPIVLAREATEQHAHSTECRRYLRGAWNTTEEDCTCWVRVFQMAWQADVEALAASQERVRELEAVKAREEALNALTHRNCSQGHVEQGAVIVVCGHANCGEVIGDEIETGYGQFATLAASEPPGEEGT